jgi:hypothetical protein
MAFVTIAGIDLPITRDGVTELAPEQGGTKSRTWNGGRRSTIRWEKRVWQMQTTMMLPATIDTFRTAIALGAQVVMTGLIVNGTNVTVECEVAESPFITASGAPNNYWRVLTLRVYEV